MGDKDIKKVAFIGIGQMGWPMASRLVAAGFEVTVHDADPDRAARFVDQAGGRYGQTPAETVESVDAVVTMLPNSQLVSEVFDRIISELAPGAIVIDMTSGNPEVTQRLAARAQLRDILMIDAAVSGGVPRAESGELAIMTGGSPQALHRALPLLRAMGTTVTEVGPIGSGQAMKALNNLVSAGGFIIGIEALLIGKKFGLDAETMVDVLNASTGMNNSTQKKFKQFVLSGKFNSNFSLDLLVKDLGIALSIAGEKEVSVPFSELCRTMWSDAAKQLGKGKDHTEMTRYCEHVAGVNLNS